MRATKVDAHREVMNAIPSGTSSLPSIPERKNKGTKLTIIIRVELRIGIRTSFEASKTTFSVDFLCSKGKCRFSRNRLNTFSTSTMASSTSEPIAMAIPPKLIVFMVSPINLRVSTDITNDKGMVTSEISVVLTFIRKMKRTITTNNPPSRSDFLTLSMELFMNLSCL